MVSFFLYSHFGKQEKMQLLAKFKRIQYVKFRGTLNFRTFKLALSPMYIYFLKLCKKLHLILLIKI